MDPNNPQNVPPPQPTPLPQQPVQAPPPPPVQEPVPQAPQSSENPPSGESHHGSRRLLYGLLIILLALLVIAGLYGAYLYSTRTVVEETVETERIEITATPTPSAEPSPSVESDADLDGIIDELDQEDATIESELESLDNDSNF